MIRQLTFHWLNSVCTQCVINYTRKIDVVKIAVDIVVAEARKGMEVTLIANNVDEIRALNEACISLQNMARIRIGKT